LAVHQDARSHVFLGAATNWLAFAATLGVSFFLTPFLIAGVGTARYDVWCVAESILAYFTLLDMGIAACLVRYVAKHHAAGGRDPLNRIASSCLGLYTAAGLTALAVGTPVLVALSPTLDARAGNPGDVLPFTLLMLANLAATLPLSVFPSVLDGLERFTAKSAVRMVFLAIRTAGVVYVVTEHAGFLSLAVVFTAANLAEHAAMAALCFRFLPGMRLHPGLIDRATLRQVRGYSIDAFLAMLAGRVTVQTGAIVVGLFLPAGQVTIFATAARLVEYAKTLLRTVTTTLTPGVSAMEARGDDDGIRRLFLSTTRWVLYLVLPVNLGLWFFGKPFLVRWVPAVGADADTPLAILAATLAVGVAQSVASRMLYGLGRLRLFARLALVEAFLNLLLTVTLVVPFGVDGVAVAVAVPNIVFCVVVIGYAVQEIGVGGREYLRAWLRPLSASVAPSAVWLMTGDVQPTWVAIGTAIAAGLLPYGIVVSLLEIRLAASRRRATKLTVPAPILLTVPPSVRGSGIPYSGSSPR
jgi:O-antigen/teichoic acid export membrane protein